MLQFDTVCCGVLPCVTVCCRALPCVAVCCRVLQCVVACCSVCCRNEPSASHKGTHRRVSGATSDPGRLAKWSTAASYPRSLATSSLVCVYIYIYVNMSIYKYDCIQTYTHTHIYVRFDRLAKSFLTSSYKKENLENLNTLQQTSAHCNTLQHSATLCNTLQHTATHC
jgi:hypothetical protein